MNSDFLCVNELERVRQWFNTVQDLNENFLEREDFILAKKIYEKLEMQVPISIRSLLGDTPGAGGRAWPRHRSPKVLTLGVVTRIEDFGVSSELHLCDSCCLDFLTCPANILIWGDGRGDDNVVACISYEPIM